MVLAHNVEDGQRTSDVQISADVTFETMLLANNTLKGLKSSGFYKPSPIQLHGIPLGKCGFDLFLEAKSGTGKTAVFSIIALEKLNLDQGLQSVILAPTREIAAQISDVIKQMGSSYEGLNVEVVMGGLSVEDDIEKFKKKVHVLVGSPGRMRHLIQGKYIDVSAVRLYVLDEADKLMDKTFQADINYIFSALPKQKQVIMSSATYPETLKAIMQNYVQKVQHICPDSTSILLGIKQLVTTVVSNVNVVRQTQNKFEELLKILSKQKFKQCLIFCNYQVRVGELCKMLMREKWPAEQLHGQLEQSDRLDALKTLQEYKCRILVSTDLAARGIDASNVDLVINFEPPFEWQTYLHRIGRAGRFGSYGIAITILSEGKEQTKFKEVMRNVQSSIELNYLWTGSQFELDDPKTDNCMKKSLVDEEILEASKLLDKCEVSKVEQKTVTVNKEDLHKGEICSGPSMIKVSKIADKPPNTPVCKTEVAEDVTKCKKLNESAQNLPPIFDLFKKSKECKIESFDDLVASFKDHESNNSKTEINIQDITCTEYFKPLLNGNCEPKIILESDSDTDLEDYMHKDKLPKATVAVSSHPQEQLINTSPGNNEEQSLNIQAQSNLQLHNVDYFSPLDASSKALRDAGLPTCFGSKKHSNKNLVKGCKSSTDQKISNKKLSNIKNKATSNRNKCQLPRKNLGEVQMKSSSEANTVSFEDDGYNTQSCLLSRLTKCKLPQNEKQKNCGNIEDLDSYSKNSNNNKKANVAAYQKYISWYNELKCHIKQVEMTLYLNELSREEY